MKEASSSITLEQVKGRHKPPSTHVQHSKFSVDNVTLGKVEGSVKVCAQVFIRNSVCLDFSLIGS